MSLAAPQPPAAPPGLAGPLTPRFGAGSVIGRTFSVWWHNVLVFSAVALLLQAPVVVGNVLLGTRAPFDASVARPALRVIELLLGFVLTGALTSGVIRSLRGQRVRFGEILDVGARRFWPIVVASIGSGLRILLWSLLLVVPGVVAACGLALAVPAAVVEPDRFSIDRSRELTKGHRLTVFLLFAVFWVVVIVVGAVAGLAAELSRGAPPIVVPIVEAFVTVVGSGIWATWPAVAYHDLRVEKEGVDPADLASVFE